MRRFIQLCVLGLSVTAAADDWPQWRGPQRDGVWRETGILTAFGSAALRPRWQVPVGAGYNGPTVARGRVFVMDRVNEPAPVERVHCLAAATGESLWTHAYPCVYRKVGYPAGPRAAVLAEADRAYCLGTMGDLRCLDAAQGDVVWGVDLKEAFDIQIPIWGVSAAPLIHEDLLIVQAGGRKGACLVALDKTTGVERWRALDDKASYCGPRIVEQAGQSVLICRTGSWVSGLDPRTGARHWQVPFAPERMVIAIADPVIWQDWLFNSSFYDGAQLIKLDTQALRATQIWRRVGRDEKQTDALHCCISTPLIRDNYIYGVDSYGQLRCLDLATGDRIWESQVPVPRARWANIHMVQHEDRVWMFTERGDLIISELSPAGYREISRTHLIDPTTAQLNQRGGVCWSHPAFANRCIYVRNDEEIRCFSLRQE